MRPPASAFRLFHHAHATHPDWAMACSLVLAQLRASLANPAEFVASPTLALLYITDHYAIHAEAILDVLSAQLPEITDWSGTVGVGIAVTGAEYFDEPALAVMLCAFPVNGYRVFSGVSPLPALVRSAQRLPGSFQAHTALVHLDASTPDAAELVAEMAQRTQSGYVFGGLASSRAGNVQFALSGHGNLKGQGAASGVFAGGLSGVAFARGTAIGAGNAKSDANPGDQDNGGDDGQVNDPMAGMGLLSRVSQGCRPLSKWKTITACDGNVVLELDGQPALPVLLLDLDIDLADPRIAMARLRGTLVGLMAAPASSDALATTANTTTTAVANSAAHHRRTGEFGSDVMVRHIIGLDPANSGIAIANPVHIGQSLAFCERNADAARSDLLRICTEIRSALEPDDSDEDLLSPPPTINNSSNNNNNTATATRRIAGAVFISCAGRGGPHFGAPHAELQIIRRALGDVPLVGFFAGGEIARNQIYGYTGVLTVFTWPA